MISILAVLLLIASVAGLTVVTGAIFYVAKGYVPPFRNEVESADTEQPNYYRIRALERELYGTTFTNPDGTPEEPTQIDEYYATHDKVPMVNPKPQPITKYSDYEYTP